jgi:ABC-type transport system substrate-binding protein
MSSETTSELDLVVGSMITVRPDEDRAAYDEEYASVAEVQDQLREEGLDVDLLSQPGTEVWEGSLANMGALYQLSRFAARIEHEQEVADVIEDGPVIYDDLDRAVTDVWDELVKSRFQHLINLQGINSYYMPADFDQPIWLSFEDEDGEEDNAFFGSSARLQGELVELAPLLIKAGVASNSDAYRCLELLREAAAKSLEFALPIIVW